MRILTNNGESGYRTNAMCDIRVSIPWISTGHWRDVQIWLLDNVQNGYDILYQFCGEDFHNRNNRVYYFAKEQDASMFLLRWA